MLGMALAAGVAIASLAPLWGRNLRRTPLSTYGMVVAHFGVAVCLAGMAAESAFIKERLVAAAPGDVIKVADFAVEICRPETDCRTELDRDRRRAGGDDSATASFTMRPQARTFPGRWNRADRNQRSGAADAARAGSFMPCWGSRLPAMTAAPTVTRCGCGGSRWCGGYGLAAD